MRKTSERKPVYKEVLNARTLLIGQGKKPTYDNIIAITGGNFNVLKEHLEIIEAIEKLANTKSVSLPDFLLDTLKYVITNHSLKESEDLENTIEEQKLKLNSVFEQLSVVQAERDACSEQLNEAEKQWHVRQIEAEKQIAAAQQRIEDLLHQLRDLEKVKDRMGHESLQTKALEIELSKHKDAEQRLSDKITQLEMELSVQQDQRLQLVRREAALESGAEELRAHLKHAHDKCEKAESYRDRCESRLEEMSKAYAEISSEHAVTNARLEEKTAVVNELSGRLRNAENANLAVKKELVDTQEKLQQCGAARVAEEKRADILAIRLEQAQATLARIEAARDTERPSSNHNRKSTKMMKAQPLEEPSSQSS